MGCQSSPYHQILVPPPPQQCVPQEMSGLSLLLIFIRGWGEPGLWRGGPRDNHDHFPQGQCCQEPLLS